MPALLKIEEDVLRLRLELQLGDTDTLADASRPRSANRLLGLRIRGRSAPPRCPMRRIVGDEDGARVSDFLRPSSVDVGVGGR